MSHSQWCGEMDQTAVNFHHLFRIFTETLLDEEYHHFGGPIVPRLYEVYRKFCSGDLEALDAQIERLSRLNMDLGRDYVQLLGDAGDHLDNWDGEAAENARSYLRGVEGALNRKRECIDAMIMVVKAQRKVVEKFQTDINSLIEATNKGIEQAGENAQKMNFAIIGAVAAVVGAFTAGAGAAVVVAVGAAMAGGAASIASASLDGGGSRAQVIVNMVVAGEQLIEAAEQERAVIEKGINAITQYFTGNELKYVRPDRPKVVTDKSYQPDDFHPEEGYTPQVRDKLPKGDVVEEPPKDEDRESDHGPWDTEDRYPEQIRSS